MRQRSVPAKGSSLWLHWWLRRQFGWRSLRPWVGLRLGKFLDWAFSRQNLSVSLIQFQVTAVPQTFIPVWTRRSVIPALITAMGKRIVLMLAMSETVLVSRSSSIRTLHSILRLLTDKLKRTRAFSDTLFALSESWSEMSSRSLRPEHGHVLPVGG